MRSLNYPLPSNAGHELMALMQLGKMQTDAFITRKDKDHSACTKILLKAAAGNSEALDALISLSVPYIYAKCPSAQWQEQEDIVQEVLTRIIRRFRNHDMPFRATTYPAYLNYLRLTVRSVIVNMSQSISLEVNCGESLEQLSTWYDYPQKSACIATTTERKMLAEELLNLLPCVREREAIARRYLLSETPAEIAKAMSSTTQSVTKKQVYRFVERGLRRLANTNRVQHLLEKEL